MSYLVYFRVCTGIAFVVPRNAPYKELMLLKKTISAILWLQFCYKNKSPNR